MISNGNLKKKILSKLITEKGYNKTSLSQLVLKKDIGDGDWILSDDMCAQSNNKLIQLGSIGFGKYIEKPFKYIDNETFDRIKCSEVNEGDLLINRFISNNQMGACIIPKIEDRLLTSVDVCWIKENKEKYNNNYLMYCFLTDEVQREVMLKSSGTTRIRISKNKLIKIEFPLAPIEEQEKIVKKIEELFELIDKKEKNDQEKDKLKNLLKERILNDYLDMHGDYKEVSELLQKTNNIKWDTDSSNYKYIDLTSVDRETRCINDTAIINKTNAPSRAKQIVNTNDIIFGTTRPLLKRLCLITDEYDNQICSTGYCVLRPISELLDSKYLMYNLMSKKFYDYIEPLQRGVSYPAVSDKDVKGFNIRLPLLSEQKKLVEKIDSLFELVEQL